MEVESSEDALNEACQTECLSAEMARLSGNLKDCEQQITALNFMLELMRRGAEARDTIAPVAKSA